MNAREHGELLPCTLPGKAGCRLHLLRRTLSQPGPFHWALRPVMAFILPKAWRVKVLIWALIPAEITEHNVVTDAIQGIVGRLWRGAARVSQAGILFQWVGHLGMNKKECNFQRKQNGLKHNWKQYWNISFLSNNSVLSSDWNCVHVWDEHLWGHVSDRDPKAEQQPCRGKIAEPFITKSWVDFDKSETTVWWHVSDSDTRRQPHSWCACRSAVYMVYNGCLKDTPQKLKSCYQIWRPIMVENKKNNHDTI